MSRQAFVLGCGRSGTSLVAGVLYHLGVPMGDHLLGPTASNPYGHFEDKELLDLNEQILAELGYSWRKPPPQTVQLPREHRLRQDVEAAVQARDAKHALWGFKDPRLSLLLRYWEPYLTDPIYVVCWRGYEATARSLARWYELPLGEAKELVVLYHTRLWGICERLPSEPSTISRILHVYMEDMLSNPRAGVERLANCLGINITEAAVQHIKVPR